MATRSDMLRKTSLRSKKKKHMITMWSYRRLTMKAVLVLAISAILCSTSYAVDRSFKNNSDVPLSISELKNDKDITFGHLYVMPGETMIVGGGAMPLHGAGFYQAVGGNYVFMTTDLKYAKSAFFEGKLVGLRVDRIEWDRQGCTIAIAGLKPFLEAENNIAITSDIQKPRIKNGNLYITLEGRGEQEYWVAMRFGRIVGIGKAAAEDEKPPAACPSEGYKKIWDVENLWLSVSWSDLRYTEWGTVSGIVNRISARNKDSESVDLKLLSTTFSHGRFQTKNIGVIESSLDGAYLCLYVTDVHIKKLRERLTSNKKETSPILPANEKPDSFDKWVNDLSSDSNEILATAAFSLAQTGCEDTVGPLMSLLTTTKHQEPFDCATMVLGHLRSHGATSPMLSLLKSDKWYERKAAAWVLGRLKDERAEQGLISLLDDDSPKVQMYAIWALGRLGSKPALSDLELIAKETKQDAIQREVQAAIESIRNGVRTRVDSPLPPWILVAGQDIPNSDITGVKMTIAGKNDHMWGYTIESDEGCSLEITPYNFGLIVHAGSGKITCPLPLEKGRTVVVSVK